MVEKLNIVSPSLLEAFEQRINFNPIEQLQVKSQESIPFDYFKFYNSISSVYSSKIEGEEIDVDSYIKHKFLNVQYEPDYTKKADDLYEAYAYMESHPLNEANVLTAHAYLSQNLLAKSQRGRIRTNPMFVINEEDRIEYVACAPEKVKREWSYLFQDIAILLDRDLNAIELFYYAAFIHLVFLKIHPMQDGNGRTARLLEKWFLKEKIGSTVASLELEKNYYLRKQDYYNNIRAIGLEYESIDYSKGIDFMLMTVLTLA